MTTPSVHYNWPGHKVLDMSVTILVYSKNPRVLAAREHTVSKLKVYG